MKNLGYINRDLNQECKTKYSEPDSSGSNYGGTRNDKKKIF